MRTNIVFLFVVSVICKSESGLIEGILTKQHETRSSIHNLAGSILGGISHGLGVNFGGQVGVQHGNKPQYPNNGQGNPETIVVIVEEQTQPEHGYNKPGYDGPSHHGHVHHHHHHGYGDRPDDDHKPNYNNNYKPGHGGHRPSYGQGQFPQKPGYEENQSFPDNNRPGYGNNRPGYGNNRPGHEGHRPGYGQGHPQKPEFEQNKPIPDNYKPGYGNRPGHGGHRPGYGGQDQYKPTYNENRPSQDGFQLGYENNRPSHGDHRPGYGQGVNNQPGYSDRPQHGQQPGFENNQNHENQGNEKPHHSEFDQPNGNINKPESNYNKPDGVPIKPDYGSVGISGGDKQPGINNDKPPFGPDIGDIFSNNPGGFKPEGNKPVYVNEQPVFGQPNIEQAKPEQTNTPNHGWQQNGKLPGSHHSNSSNVNKPQKPFDKPKEDEPLFIPLDPNAGDNSEGGTNDPKRETNNMPSQTKPAVDDDYNIDIRFGDS